MMTTRELSSGESGVLTSSMIDQPVKRNRAYELARAIQRAR